MPDIIPYLYLHQDHCWALTMLDPAYPTPQLVNRVELHQCLLRKNFTPSLRRSKSLPTKYETRYCQFFSLTLNFTCTLGRCKVHMRIAISVHWFFHLNHLQAVNLPELKKDKNTTFLLFFFSPEKFHGKLREIITYCSVLTSIYFFFQF